MCACVCLCVCVCLVEESERESADLLPFASITSPWNQIPVSNLGLKSSTLDQFDDVWVGRTGEVWDESSIAEHGATLGTKQAVSALHLPSGALQLFLNFFFFLLLSSPDKLFSKARAKNKSELD